MFLKGLNLLAALLLAAEYGSAQDAPALRYNVKLQPGATLPSLGSLDTLGSSAAAGGAALPADAVVSNRIEFSSFKGFTVDVGSTVDPGALSRRAVMDRRLQLIACLEGLKRAQIIEYYEEDVLGSAAAIQQEVPSYGLSRVSQRNFNVETRYHYPDDGGRNSVVYILDSGVRVSHPDFGGRAIFGVNMIETETLDDALADVNGHGTHVAGTVGSSTYGVAKNTTLITVKILSNAGWGSAAQIAGGVYWAVAHDSKGKKKVINMSIVFASRVQYVDDAVAAAYNSGIVVAVAAGNVPDKSACDITPAGAPESFTVGSIDSTDSVSDFSSRGPCIDIFGPGSAINSTSNNGVGWRLMWGTSMATPHVAGAAALVRSQNPSFTALQTQNFLLNSATNGILGLRADEVDKLLYNSAQETYYALRPQTSPQDSLVVDVISSEIRGLNETLVDPIPWRATWEMVSVNTSVAFRSYVNDGCVEMVESGLGLRPCSFNSSQLFKPFSQSGSSKLVSASNEAVCVSFSLSKVTLAPCINAPIFDLVATRPRGGALPSPVPSSSPSSTASPSASISASTSATPTSSPSTSASPSISLSPSASPSLSASVSPSSSPSASQSASQSASPPASVSPSASAEMSASSSPAAPTPSSSPSTLGPVYVSPGSPSARPSSDRLDSPSTATLAYTGATELTAIGIVVLGLIAM